MDYKKLQNGSDIRGVAMEGVAGQPVNLTDRVVTNIGRGFAAYLQKKLGRDKLTLAVGRDSRLSGERLLKAFAQGAMAQGADVMDFGLASTPSMFMCTVTEGWRCDGAAMLTASHLPFNRNGVKLFTARGGFEKADIANVLALAEAFPKAQAPGIYGTADFLSVYAAGLRRIIVDGVNAPDRENPLSGFHIVVDAGNGAGGFYAHQVLAPLGADISGSQFLEPDGHFKNHAPNPEDPAAMNAMRDCVLRNRADLGLIFDTDVDRAGAVSAEGVEINRNRLIALISAVVLREHPGTTIVTDSITSSGLAAFIGEKGGVHHRFKRGYRNVINESIRLNSLGQDSQLAIETSGHGALKENYFLDDGAYLVTKLVIEMARLKKRGRTLMSLIDTLAEPLESVEVRMGLSGADFAALGTDILEQLAAYAAEQRWDVAGENYEGIRVSFPAGEGDGWFLLRMSLHDPLMPLNIESNSPGGVQKIAGRLYGFLKTCRGLDCQGLQKLAG